MDNEHTEREVDGEIAISAEQVSGASPTELELVGAYESTGNRNGIKKKSKFRYNAYLFVKRTFDIISSGLLLIVLSWLILICLLVKWIEDFRFPKYELIIEETDRQSVCAKGVTLYAYRR